MAEICVASHHSSVQELLADAEFSALARREGFLVELRLDFYRDLTSASLDQLLDRFAPSCVVTYRHPAEGGKNAAASDRERLSFLEQAASRGSRYVDIEARTPRDGFNKHTSQLILSYHDFENCPPAQELLSRWKAMREQPGVDVVKIACTPRTILESAALLDLLAASRDARRPMLALGMGEFGFWTRVAGPLFGSPFTFARGVDASGTAPGQPTFQELDQLYRFRQIKAGWPVFGVIGNPIAHSLSPLLHNTALSTLKLDGVYLPFKVDGDPARFVTRFAPLGLRGLSVTIPHKESLGSLCAEVDPIARATGAINTLSRKQDGSWLGANTDALAAADSLETAVGSLQGKTCLVVGAGGAARAVVFGIKARGASVLIMNRHHERAAQLAAEAGAKAVERTELKNIGRIDAIINTTPVGMHPAVDASPLEKSEFSQGSVVFDTVYNPRDTKLLSMARECGCKTIDGLAMFMGQARRQFELWTGKALPLTVVEPAVAAALAQRRN